MFSQPSFNLVVRTGAVASTGAAMKKISTAVANPALAPA
jgi:hypothetical protein